MINNIILHNRYILCNQESFHLCREINLRFIKILLITVMEVMVSDCDAYLCLLLNLEYLLMFAEYTHSLPLLFLYRVWQTFLLSGVKA